MAKDDKIKSRSKACPPACSGGAGYLYEYNVLTSYVVMMLTNGFIPTYPNYSIDEISFQTSSKGYLVDDFLINLSNQQNRCKILGQIKRTIYFTESDENFRKTLSEAWNDYNNPNKFDPLKDKFFIITESLTRSDYSPVMWLLDNSRHLLPEEFFTAIDEPNISPTDTKQKFEIFKKIINSFDENTNITDEKLYTFLKSIYILIYDFGRDESIVKSLFLSYISQFTDGDPVDVWNSIFIHTADMDAHGGTIIYKLIPKEIKARISSKREIQPTSKLQTESLSNIPFDEIENEDYISAIIAVLLLGAWDENNPYDISIIESLVEMSYNKFVHILHKLERKTNSPFTNSNSIWTIKNPYELIKHWESWIYEINITQFKNVAIKIFHGDSQSCNPDNCKYYSEYLCNGIATTIAILSSLREEFSRVSSDRIDTYIASILYDVLKDSNVSYWSNIEALLPLFAEASPLIYLRLLQNNINGESSPIKELFCKDSSDYNTDGIVRSLEILAWKQEFFKQACKTLVQLASIDIKSPWRRRPVNSLRSILMPWHPHTLADKSARISVLHSIVSENPDFAWEFLPDLLPDSRVSITRTTTPKYLISIQENIPYFNEEELKELRIICEGLIIQLAERNSITNWEKFIIILPDFLDDAFNKFVDEIQNNFDTYSEAKKISIWESLSQLVNRHKNHKEEKWAMDQSRIDALDSIVELYKPKDILNLNKRLFDNYNSDLISTKTKYDYDAYRKELEIKQFEAVQEIYNEGRLQRIIEFVHIVKRPECVGYSMGAIELSETDQVILPEYLNSKSICEQEFIKTYIIKRFCTKGWSWVKTINPNAWTINAKTTFLCCLPLGDCTWSLVNNWLGDQSNKYWEQITIYRCLDSIDNQYVIRNLLSCKRYDLLISILWDGIHNKKSYIKINDIIQTLINLETWDHDQLYTISKLIEHLQSQPDIDIDTMFDIELKYYTEDERSFSYPPINIERKLINQPKLFCKYLALVSKPLYRYNATMQNDAANIKDLSDIYNKFSDIFDDWTTIPGTDNNGCFFPEEFQSWFESVSAEAAKIGIEKKLKETIGGILTKAPADDDGFWIHHTIAKLLNRYDVEDIRDGYYQKKVGVYGYTYSEDNLRDEQTKADKYIQLAKDSKARGYGYLAELLNRLAGHHQGIIYEIRQRLEEDKQQYGE